MHQLTFQPAVNPGSKQRTFEQYIADKEAWQRGREEEVERKRMAVEVSKLN